ncbi:MAG: hypothetical protein KY468_16280 [Armatimonadetes bacterium]|nr:hypothetical protein [Armatimonadota bacterium]
MARKHDELNAGKDELMIDVQVLCSDARTALSRRDLREALRLVDRIDDLAHRCNGARNEGREAYLTCTECPRSREIWDRAFDAGRLSLSPLKILS